MVNLAQALKVAVTLALLGQSVVAHANHDINQDIAERNAFYKDPKRDFTHCNDLLRKRGMENKQAKRRQAALEAARAKRGLPQGELVSPDCPNTIENPMWDLWHCNGTGVYGGVISSGNGNEVDLSNLNNTFLRGLQATDADGIASFESILPDHYAGRATHMHVVGWLNGTILPNGTYAGGTVSHSGQFFFDQDLITEINVWVKGRRQVHVVFNK